MAIRTRIGLIVPSTNSTAEPDFNVVAPRDVTIHSQRMWIGGLDKEGMDRMNEDVEQAASYLATANVKFVVYACTTGSFYKGPGHDQELLETVQRMARVPATATALAGVEALRFLGAKKVSIASPYNRWQNERLGLYYEGMGFEVLNVESEEHAADGGAQGHCDLSLESILEFAPTVCRPEADALFCSCTAWRTMEVVAELERLTGKPVVTANQATVWVAFKHLGITNPKPGFGSLIDSLAKVVA